MVPSSVSTFGSNITNGKLTVYCYENTPGYNWAMGAGHTVVLLDGGVNDRLFYLPEESLVEARFRQLYGEWRREGWLVVTPGNVVDYDFILNDLRDLTRDMYLMGVAYDAWNATQFVINATDAGLPMEPFSQTLGAFNRPTKEFERLMLSGRARLDNNGITRYCIRNVVLARDRNGNIKPSKQFAERKIDGVIAILESLGVYLASPRFQGLL